MSRNQNLRWGSPCNNTERKFFFSISFLRWRVQTFTNLSDPSFWLMGVMTNVREEPTGTPIHLRQHGKLKQSVLLGVINALHFLLNLLMLRQENCLFWKRKKEIFSWNTPASTSDGWVVHNILGEAKHGSLCLKNVGKSTWGNDPCKRLGARRLHFTTTHKKKKVYQPEFMTQLGGEGDKKGDFCFFDWTRAVNSYSQYSKLLPFNHTNPQKK